MSFSPLHRKLKAVTQESSLRAAQTYLTDHFGDSSIMVYEAGGGSDSYLPLDRLQVTNVLVVDIDFGQLKRNEYSKWKVKGDVQSCAFKEGSFDLIVCYNVIEHLDAPDAAIRLFYEALAPGGLLFIGAPNPSSLTGLITKYTPHLLHVAYYKYLRGWEDAGKPGFAPFPTVYSPIVKPERLKKFCVELGFHIEYFCEYRSSHYASIEESNPLLGRLLIGLTGVLNAMTFGTRDLTNGDYHLIARKSGSTLSRRARASNPNKSI